MVVFSSGASAATSTVAVISPTSSCASMVACCWTLSGKALRTKRLKPLASIAMV